MAAVWKRKARTGKARKAARAVRSKKPDEVWIRAKKAITRDRENPIPRRKQPVFPAVADETGSREAVSERPLFGYSLSLDFHSAMI